MRYTHVFVDFDETLFNHDAYFDWLDEIFAARPAKEGFRRAADKFHAPMGEKLRLYDHRGHAQAATGRVWEIVSGEIEKRLRARGEDFCYPDAHLFLRRLAESGSDVRLLTYGDPEYQRFKICSCSVIRQLYLPVHVVLQPKRVFLGEHFRSASGVLVDDKYPLHLPANWHHMWLDRDSELPATERVSRRVTKAGSLDQILAAWNLQEKSQNHMP